MMLALQQPIVSYSYSFHAVALWVFVCLKNVMNEVCGVDTLLVHAWLRIKGEAGRRGKET